MKRILIPVLAAATVAWALLGCAASQKGEKTVGTDLMSDTWVATDALGRQMPLIDSVGPVKKDHDRVVGIFYITWHSQRAHKAAGHTDVTKFPSTLKRIEEKAFFKCYYWEEFCNDRETLMFESEKILAQIQNISIEDKYREVLDLTKDLRGETKERVIKTRVNQNVFSLNNS